MPGMTYDAAAAFAALPGFRHIAPVTDGGYTVVLTGLRRVSSALLIDRRDCATPDEVHAISDGNDRLILEMSQSRHTIQREAAAEAVARMAGLKAQSATVARTSTVVLVPGING